MIDNNDIPGIGDLTPEQQADVRATAAGLGSNFPRDMIVPTFLSVRKHEADVPAHDVHVRDCQVCADQAEGRDYLEEGMYMAERKAAALVTMLARMSGMTEEDVENTVSSVIYPAFQPGESL